MLLPYFLFLFFSFFPFFFFPFFAAPSECHPGRIAPPRYATGRPYPWLILEKMLMMMTHPSPRECSQIYPGSVRRREEGYISREARWNAPQTWPATCRYGSSSPTVAKRPVAWLYLEAYKRRTNVPHFSVWPAFLHLTLIRTPFQSLNFWGGVPDPCPQVTSKFWGIDPIQVNAPPRFDEQTPLTRSGNAPIRGVICFAMSFISIFSCCIQCSPDPLLVMGWDRDLVTPSMGSAYSPTPSESKSWMNAWFGDRSRISIF